jgi:GNAT superfamily N-acetyltransferase
MDPVVVRSAEPRDAFSVAALHLQAERERGESIPQGFLDTLADAWLRDRSRQSWLAEDLRHNPLGAAHGTVVRTLPTPREGSTAWMHLGFLYVTADARGQGLGSELLHTVLTWCEAQDVGRVQLNALEQTRGLYERAGFGPPAHALMERRL